MRSDKTNSSANSSPDRAEVTVVVGDKKFTAYISQLLPGDPIEDKVFIDKQMAFHDFRHLTKYVKADLRKLNRFIAMYRKRVDKNGLSGRGRLIILESIDRYTDILLNDMFHWYKAVHNKQFNKKLKKLIKENLNNDTEILITHVRNIRYHWEKTRHYFQQTKPNDKQGKSVRWFMDKYPIGHNPFSIKSGLNSPTLLASVINIEELEKEINKIEKIIKLNVRKQNEGPLHFYL